MLDKSAQAGQHSYKARGQDLYETPTVAIEALLRVERIPERVWEPACGPGSIVAALKAAGHKVMASDVRDYGWGHELTDFLKVGALTNKFYAVVTNPPYRFAAEFIRKAVIELECPYVAMLLRLAFLESASRTDILDVYRPARIHVFKKRLPMMHRAGWKGKKASSAIAFAWFVWEGRMHGSKTIIDRIDW